MVSCHSGHLAMNLLVLQILVWYFFLMPYSRKIFCVAFTDDVHVEIIISVHTAKVNFCQTHTEKIIRSTCNN